MELTDNEIRSVGSGRYLRKQRLRLFICGLVALAWLFAYGFLIVPDNPTTGDQWAFVLLAGVPAYAAILWPFILSGRAGKRFLTEWRLEGSVHKGDLWCSYCAGQQFHEIHPPACPQYLLWECVACGAQFDDNPGYGYFTSYWGRGNTPETIAPFNPNTGKRFLAEWRDAELAALDKRNP